MILCWFQAPSRVQRFHPVGLRCLGTSPPPSPASSPCLRSLAEPPLPLPAPGVCIWGGGSTHPVQVPTSGSRVVLATPAEAVLPAARHLPRRLHLLLTQGRYRPSDPGEKPASEAALPPPQPAMPRKSLEQVYGRTGCHSVPLHRARLATVIVREGTRFRLTREGCLLFLVQRSRPTAALASPCTTPPPTPLEEPRPVGGGAQPLGSLGRLPGI